MASSIISARKLALLLLLHAPDGKGRPARPIAGITRLQKLTFLVWTRLGHMSPSRELIVDFNYQPQRFGPADSELYADLEFLTALGHVTRSRLPPEAQPAAPPSAAQLNFDDLVEASSTQPQEPSEEVSLEQATEDQFNFEYLMADEEIAADLAAGERVEDWFAITASGVQLLNDIELHLSVNDRSAFDRLQQAANEVRQTYGDWPLQRLLRFIYSNYPNMITESEIKARVLGTGP